MSEIPPMKATDKIEEDASGETEEEKLANQEIKKEETVTKIDENVEDVAEGGMVVRKESEPLVDKKIYQIPVHIGNRVEFAKPPRRSESRPCYNVPIVVLDIPFAQLLQIHSRDEEDEKFMQVETTGLEFDVSSSDSEEEEPSAKNRRVN